MEYRHKFKNYLEDLGKKKPSPGGGSAAPLVFCLAVSLIEKAIKYSLDKSPYLEKYLYCLRALSEKIYPYIDLDGKIFEQILKAEGRKKKKLIRQSERIIIGLATASVSAFSLAKKAESGIKKGIISDFYIGEEFLKVTLKSCIYNLEANRIILKRDNKFILSFKRKLKRWEKY